MLKRSLAAGLLACVAFTPLAQAQDTPPASPPQQGQNSSGNFIQTLQSEQFRGSDLMGQNVYNEQDENIGSVGDILLDQQGKVAGVVIDVGGFLGIGANEVAVNFDALQFEPEEVAASTPAGSQTTMGRSATSDAAANQPGGDPAASSSAMSKQSTSAEKSSSSSSTLHAKIVLNASRNDLKNAPKLDDTAARGTSK